MKSDSIHSCELILEFSSAEKAELVAGAVSLDNPEFIKVECDGKFLKSKISASTISSLLHSLDDYLACIALAENIVTNREENTTRNDNK